MKEMAALRSNERNERNVNEEMKEWISLDKI
jgi:hypothetical protein